MDLNNFDGGIKLPEDEEAERLVALYRQMLKEDKKLFFTPTQYLIIIDHYRRKKRDDAALFAADISLGQYPKDRSLRKQEIEILIQKERIEEAMPKLFKMVSEDPKDTSVLLLLGKTYIQVGDIKQAKGVFDEVLALEDDESNGFICLFAASNFKQHEQYLMAVRFYKLALKYGQDFFEDMHATIASCYEKAGDIEKAILFYNKQLKLFPYTPEAWFSLGVIQIGRKEYEAAAASFEFAVAIKPDHPAALYYLAEAYEAQKKYTKAQEIAQEYLDIDPDDEKALVLVANCHVNLDEHHKALSYYNRALGVNGKSAEAFHGLAVHHLVCQELEDALYNIKRALKYNPEFAASWLVYGDIEMQLCSPDKAIHAYEKCIEMMPQIEQAWLNISDIFYNAGQYDVAVALLEKSYKTNYAEAKTNFRLAAYYLQTNNDKGIQHLEEGLQIDKSELNEFVDWYPAYIVNDEVKHILNLYSISY